MEKSVGRAVREQDGVCALGSAVVIPAANTAGGKNEARILDKEHHARIRAPHKGLRITSTA